jgi:hypothetical protein
MRNRRCVALAAIVLGGFLFAKPLLAQSGSFPHDTHSPFFSECSACHTVVPQEDQVGTYPEFSSCSACHDGSTAPPIQWAAPEPRSSSLAFSHSPHGFDCSTCHSSSDGTPGAMSFPQPETCLSCHAPETNHEETEDCGFCHSTVSTFAFTDPGLSAQFHEPGFERSHGAAASAGLPDCTSCHTENTCTQCHDGLGSPEFHPLNFLASHGPEAYGRVSDCTSCHNNEAFCRECHLNVGFNQEGSSFSSGHNDQGVGFFSHSFAARQDLESCVSCHQQSDCMRCHSSQTGLGVNPHGPGFDAVSMFDLNKDTCKLCHGG